MTCDVGGYHNPHKETEKKHLLCCFVSPRASADLLDALGCSVVFMLMVGVGGASQNEYEDHVTSDTSQALMWSTCVSLETET